MAATARPDTAPARRRLKGDVASGSGAEGRVPVSSTDRMLSRIAGRGPSSRVRCAGSASACSLDLPPRPERPVPRANRAGSRAGGWLASSSLAPTGSGTHLCDQVMTAEGPGSRTAVTVVP
jgi:hypothetical protein